MPDAEPVEAAPQRSWLRWVVLGMLVAGVATFYALGLHDYFALDQIRANLAVFESAVEEHFLLALLGFFALYTAVTALSLPVAPILTLLAGALFDRWLGTGVVLFAATLGATGAFLSSRWLLRDWVQRRFAHRLTAFNRGIERDGAFYLFSLRLVPVVSFFLINLALGLTPMRTWTFAWVSLIGMAPGTFVYVNVGRELAELRQLKDLVSPGFILSLALLGVMPLILRKLLQWRN